MADKVLCSGQGLTYGFIGQAIQSLVDTRNAGPGELTVFCEGTSSTAECELMDHGDGTFTLEVHPQETGRHILTIQYNGQDVPGSPFLLRVSNAGLVKTSGPGLEHGVLGNYNPHFVCDATEAGKGELTVRIGGPKGGFRLKMKRDGKNVHCRYGAKDPGIYIINVLWSGEHIPGSPFEICIASKHEELDQYLRTFTTA